MYVYIWYRQTQTDRMMIQKDINPGMKVRKKRRLDFITLNKMLSYNKML